MKGTMKIYERKTNTPMLKYEKNFQNKNLKSCYNETRNKIKKKQEERKKAIKLFFFLKCKMHHHNNIGARKHAHGTFYCNLGFRFMTKARACKGASQE
jgi:nicotinic acid phosphoribosyltransferase